MIQFVFPKDSRFMKLLLSLPCAVCMAFVVIFFSSSQIVYAANPNDSVPVTDSQVVLTATVVGGTAQASDWTFTVEGIDGEIANSTEITLTLGSYAVSLHTSSDNSEQYKITGVGGVCQMIDGQITLTIDISAENFCMVLLERRVGEVLLYPETIGGWATDSTWAIHLDGPDTVNYIPAVNSGYTYVGTGDYRLTLDGGDFIDDYSITSVSEACSWDGSELVLHVVEDVKQLCWITLTSKSVTVNFVQKIVNGDEMSSQWMYQIINPDISQQYEVIPNSTVDIIYGQFNLYPLDFGGQTENYVRLEGSGICSGTDDSLQITITAEGGDCILTHVYNPTQLTIELDNQPDTATNFNFTSTMGKFKLDDPTVDDADGIAKSKTFTVTSGTYTISELLSSTSPYFTTIECDSDESSGAIDNTARTATISLNHGQHVTCKFINQRPVVIRSYKFNDLNGNGRRNVNEPWLPNWNMIAFDLSTGNSISATTDSNGLAVFARLRPGAYMVCEEQQVGWINTVPGGALNPVYGQPCFGPFTLAPNDNVTVRFGNKQGSGFVAAAAMNSENIIYSTESDQEEEVSDTVVVRTVFLPMVAR